MIRLALVGCGAVSEQLHLPAIMANKDVVLTVTVDRDSGRAKLIAEKAGSRSFETVAEALPYFDAAIVALPHHLHASVSVQLLEAGKHVLVEKPMAITLAECDAMIAAAERGGVSLTVGQMRRFCPAMAAAKALLDRNIIGKVLNFEILEGNVYNWPVASDFFFRKETAGGGVLLDTGAHTFDSLLWLFGDPREFEYRDDAFGGVEADCSVSMTMGSGAVGHVELSRTRELPTILRIKGEQGEMNVDYKQNQVDLRIQGRQLDSWRFPVSHPSHSGLSIWLLMVVRQLDDWVDALKKGRAASVPGVEGRRVVDFIDKCYRNRKPWTFPWVQCAKEAIP